MSVALTELTSRLRSAAPARDGVPADYTELVKAAVWQYSSDVPILRHANVAIVAGVDSYQLPPDFLSLIEFVPLMQAGGVLLGGEYLIAVGSNGYQEQVWIEGDQLRISPQPAYTATRTLRYAAAHVLDSNYAYPLLTANDARLVLLYAQYLALQAQASAVAGDGWMYRIGDETVDKRGQGTSLQTQAQNLLTQYQQALQSRKGYGSRSQYTGDPDVV